jgi:hypothetical protein
MIVAVLENTVKEESYYRKNLFNWNLGVRVREFRFTIKNVNICGILATCVFFSTKKHTGNHSVFY